MQPWRKLDEETVYSRYRRVVSKRFEQPGGELVEYEIKDEDDMVAVLALTQNREVVLVRQFRPGPEAVLLELPAGVVDPGAEPAETAAAELLEETGYAGRDRARRDDARGGLLEPEEVRLRRARVPARARASGSAASPRPLSLRSPIYAATYAAVAWPTSTPAISL